MSTRFSKSWFLLQAYEKKSETEDIEALITTAMKNERQSWE
jgi:hypothetical protein